MSGNYILVMGLGLNQGGVGAARYFAQKGRDVLVTDLKDEKILFSSVKALKEFSRIKFILGEHREGDFRNAEIVIASPAVPPGNKYIDTAIKSNIPVFCPMSYFFANKKGLSIGVTGTRGKSTTTNIIYQILKKAKKKAFLGGNIGVSAFNILDELDEDSISVLEISSFMLEWMRLKRQSPQIAVITNIMRDHLDRHGTMGKYVDAKKTIFKFQNKGDLLISNFYDKMTKGFSEEALEKVITPKFSQFGFLQDLVFSDFHPLAGDHNRHNLLLAAVVAKYLDVSDDIVLGAIKNYQGLYGRQMYLGKFNGIHVVNDTCATVPEAVAVALKRFTGRGKEVILLTGGTDKDLNYRPLAKAIRMYKPKSVVVLRGSGSEKLKREVEKLNIGSIPTFWDFDNLSEAANKAVNLSSSGDILLFSPGGSSFEMFANEFNRGKKFDRIIRSI